MQEPTASPLTYLSFRQGLWSLIHREAPVTAPQPLQYCLAALDRLQPKNESIPVWLANDDFDDDTRRPDWRPLPLDTRAPVVRVTVRDWKDRHITTTIPWDMAPESVRAFVQEHNHPHSFTPAVIELVWPFVAHLIKTTDQVEAVCYAENGRFATR